MLLKIFGIIIFLLCSASNGQNHLVQNEFQRVDVFEIFANAVRNYSLIPEKKISVTCLSHLLEFVNSIEKKWWALQMYDASTKQFPGSGVLRGNLVDFGDYDECLNVTNGAGISGKYCLATIPLLQFIPKSKQQLILKANSDTRIATHEAGQVPAFALCVPDSCSVQDLEQISNLILINKFKIKFEELLCDAKTERDGLNGGDITAISVICVIFFLVAISTIYEITMYYTKQESYHPIIKAFSGFTNTKKLLQTKGEPGQISCIQGIRVITMMWIVVGHRYMSNAAVPIQNLFYIWTDWMHEKTSMLIAGATVSVDTFLLLSGLLVSFVFMTATSKGFKFNIFVFYIHRIVRLTPLLGAILLIHSTFLRHLGDGPLWRIKMNGIRDNCIEDWWKSLLYIQNYARSGNKCLPQVWYLGIDMQLYILSPILLLPLQRWPRIGIILIFVFIVASITGSFVIAWTLELYGHIVTNTFRFKREDYEKYYYSPAYTRATPWLIGIILGYYIFKIKKDHLVISINKLLCLLLWTVSLALLLFCVFAGQNTFDMKYKYNQLLESFFLSFHRPAWALGVAWVIFACATGHGGPVNKFLSQPIFQVLSRLTYSMYLIHVTVLWLINNQTRTVMNFNNLNSMHMYWGDFVFGYATAFLLSLAFESPIIGLERIIFGRKCLLNNRKSYVLSNNICYLVLERKTRNKTALDDIRTENP